MTGQPSSPPPVGAPGPVPAWLAPVVQITTSLGVPTVVAGVLLWFVLFRMGAALDVIERSEEDRVKILAAMQDTLVAALDRQTHAFEEAIKENIDANKDIAARLERSGLAPRSQP